MDTPWNPDNRLPRARASGRPRVQVMHFPSFTPATFFEICDVRPEGRWQLYTAEVVDSWYPGPVTVRGYEPLTFASDTLDAFVRRLHGLALPIAPPFTNMAGLDGELTRLTLSGDIYASCRFEWWSEPPPHWRPMVETADEMLHAFHAARG